jgi:pimeloyl-ACP methyl ester carboxylesterase
MTVFSELRYPTTRSAKLFTAILALVLFFFLGTAIISAFLLFQVVRPSRSPSGLDVNALLGQASAISFNVPGGAAREGWFFPGVRGAPTIILCHGYESQRSEVLTLVSVLQEAHYNVFVFDFAAHGTSPGITSLGYREPGEVLAAIAVLSKRDDVDASRFGLWGSDLGGYAALAAATSEPRVAALVVDSVYADPHDMLLIGLNRSGLQVLPLVERFSEMGFDILNHRDLHDPTLPALLPRLHGVPKLFIASNDRPLLAASTERLFQIAPEPRQQAVQKDGYTVMEDQADRRVYEMLVVNFFLQNLPIAGRRSR